jgi:thiol-disulfide isomerase/thioredoxin
MKLKQLIMLLAVACPLAGMAQNSKYTIEGKLKNTYNGKQIKLHYTLDETHKNIDSTIIKNGAFKFEGQLERPLVARVTMGKEDDPDGIDIFLAEGKTQLSAKDSVKYAQITGGDLVKSYEKLAKTLRPLDQKIFASLCFYRDMPEGDKKKAYIRSLMSGFDAYRQRKREIIHRFAAENTNSYVSLYMLDKNSPDRLLNYEQTFPFYEKLSNSVKETPLGKQLAARLEAVKGTLTGEQFKDFVSSTPEGTSLSLKEVVSKNKYTLVDFWASWCGPCRKENPNVVKTFTDFKDKGFTVLSVSLDDNAEKWKAAIKSDGMPWYHVSSLKGWKEPAALLYGIRAIPQNVLVDAQGKIIATNLREETLYNKVKSLLN